MSLILRSRVTAREATLMGVLPAHSSTPAHPSTLDVVAAGNEIREFLTSRRAKITPDQAGLSAYGTRRRVPGLRREEVAALAGVSIEYYAQLERGTARGVSDDVLQAVANALHLDDAECTHLFDLVRAANTAKTTRRRPTPPRIRPSVQRALDTISAPALVRNGRLDLLAANPLGRAFYAPIFDSPAGPPNIGRFAFLDPNGVDFFIDWDDGVNDVVAVLRAEAGRKPYDKDLSDLIGEFSTRSNEFRVRWAAHNVKLHRTGNKRVRHPIVGEVTVEMEVFELPTDPGQTLVIYTPEPSSPSAEALALLASWTTTAQHVATDEARHTR
jgi:transcriptional regulator with XRE-family HTH domain